ncbi:hypothetical protein H0R92_09545 [Treponema sp. OMZ 840]|uniref:hypothetical protein n=1 Tax=Treponema sp. OMZ 840 TaxID=244313 RepID=UPI003D8FCF15
MNIKAYLKPDIKLYIFLCSVFLIFSACSRRHTSSLTLHSEASSAFSKPAALTALTEAARSAVIENPTKAPFMLFSFPDNPLSEKNGLQSLIESGDCALELEVETSPPQGSRSGAADEAEQNGVKDGKFFFGFVYEQNLSSNSSRSFAAYAQGFEQLKGVRALVPSGTRFTLSLGFESAENVQVSDIRGFMVYSEIPLKVKGARITRARYGWSRADGLPWFGFSAEGGTIDASLLKNIAFGENAREAAGQNIRKTAVPGEFVFASLPPLDVNEGRELHLVFRTESSASENTDMQNDSTVEFLCGSQKLSVRRHFSVGSAIVDMRAFKSGFGTVELFTNTDTIDGVVLEKKEYSAFSPITADPGLIIDWPHKNWRNSRFELFSWQQFPSVLIFDFADYAVQNAFLKRLAFYVEKKGYTGKLLSDEKMSGIHAFNAHDYRAESLAAFFNQAEKERFPLNQSELLLRDILFANKVIVRRPEGITAGTGALISVSRESPRYLRYLFLTHEGLHGIYFTEKKFRTFADGVFYELEKEEPQAAAFLRRYFEVTPSLNYNTADSYLLKNEFMAYVLQQSPSSTGAYFTDVLSKRRFISTAEPELCDYIRKTDARAFVQAAETMSAFLYKNWGLAGGNLFFMSIN